MTYEGWSFLCLPHLFLPFFCKWLQGSQVTNWWVAKQYILFVTMLSVHMRCFSMKSICKSSRLQTSTRFSLIRKSNSVLEINSFLKTGKTWLSFHVILLWREENKAVFLRRETFKRGLRGGKNKAFLSDDWCLGKLCLYLRLQKTYIHSSAFIILLSNQCFN